MHASYAGTASLAIPFHVIERRWGGAIVGCYDRLVVDAAPSPFGQRLRQWRTLRRMSQLQLALRTDISQRHISFLENGRARPRSETVQRLGVALDVPLRDQNALLLLAGLPAAFEETPMGSGTTAPFVAALERTLDAHDPYPGLLVNGWWDIVRLNTAGRVLLGDAVGHNLARTLVDGGPLRERIVNWDAVAAAVAGRLRRDARAAPFDARLQELSAHADANLGTRPPLSHAICPAFRLGQDTVQTFSLVGELTAAHDITVQELRLELLFPLDDASADALARHAAAKHHP